MPSFSSVCLALAVAVPLCLAQTFSACDPTKKTGCPTKPGLTVSEYFTDFTTGATAAKDWTPTSGAPTYGANGAEFTINKVGDGPTIQSNFYIFFGYVETKVRAAPGAGIVSSVVMESDDLDEIDWEFIGSDTARGQTNYFGKGNTTTYDRGGFSPVTAPEATFHTYAVNWTATTTTWFIDGEPVRTLNFADAVGGKNYPQTPMNIRIGNWVAGTPGNAAGTIEWAGGLTDFSQAPFNMYVETVKIINYNPGTSYEYSDETGDWQSIKVLGATAQETVPQVATNSTSEDNSTTTVTTGPHAGGIIPYANSTADALAGSSPTGSSVAGSSSGLASNGSSGGYAPYLLPNGTSSIGAGSSNTSSPPAQFTGAAAQVVSGYGAAVMVIAGFLCVSLL